VRGGNTVCAVSFFFSPFEKKKSSNKRREKDYQRFYFFFFFRSAGGLVGGKASFTYPYHMQSIVIGLLFARQNF